MAREVTPLGDLALLEEDTESIKMRIARLETGMGWAEDPPSRTRRIVSNLKVAELGNNEVRARTDFIHYRTHLETDQDFFVGCRDDVLRREDGQWKVAKRTIVLDANIIMPRT